MRRGILGLVIGAMVAALALGAAAPARAQGEVTDGNLHVPAVYIASLNGKIGWDITPDLLVSILLDGDRTFNDLVPVVDPGPNDLDMVVHPDAWRDHVLVLRLNLTLDERATNLNLHEYLAKFKQVLSDEMNLRGRRVVIWVQRTDDLSALLIDDMPEVLLAPGASATLTPEFVERFKAEGGPAPEAPDLSHFQTCTTTGEVSEAVGLEADTTVLAGESLKAFQRWIDFRDKTLEMAQDAVGPKWDEYEKLINDPEAPLYKKAAARRDVSTALRSAHVRVTRYDDLALHPVFVPLDAEILEKMKILAETPAPREK